MKKNSNEENLKLAGRQYHTDDDSRKDEISTGLATTHEQVSDVYTEGEIKATTDNTDDGRKIDISPKRNE